MLEVLDGGLGCEDFVAVLGRRDGFGAIVQPSMKIWRQRPPLGRFQGQPDEAADLAQCDALIALRRHLFRSRSHLGK